MNKTFLINGIWKYDNLSNQIKDVEDFYLNNKLKEVDLDFSSLENIDSSGIVLLVKYILLFEKNKVKVNIVNISKKHNRMLGLYRTNYKHGDLEYKDELNFVQSVGKEAYDSFSNLKNFLYFIGRILVYFIYLILHPSKIRFKATVHQMEICAIHILPIIALALFLVGFVTAYQGADQLAKFGASIIVIEMSTMSMFREISPFLAAIIVAGRSASSFTAQIGTMKITEEISAMKTMGLDVDIFIIIPRIFALVIVMPLLVFFADIASLLGEMVIAKIHLGVSYTQFMARIYEYVEIRHILLGICKAPLFGLIIALIGCYRGLQVRSGTDIGKYTTKAVVDSIFYLIIVNALISLLSISLGF